MVPLPRPTHRCISSPGGASAELFDLNDGQVLKLFRDSVSDEMIARSGSLHPCRRMWRADRSGTCAADMERAAEHPAADAVRSEMLMRFGVGPSDWVTNLWRDWAARRLRKSYLASGAVTARDMDLWRPVVAPAWLRARDAGRTPAFIRYLETALEQAGLPAVD